MKLSKGYLRSHPDNKEVSPTDLRSRETSLRVVIRCDATGKTGLGHLSRCLGLAEALRERDVQSIFVGNYHARAQSLAERAGFTCTQSPAVEFGRDDGRFLAEIAREFSAALIVVDSYAVAPKYLEFLQKTGRHVVLIDDFCSLPQYSCDIIVNFCIGAGRLPYPRNGPKLLLGVDYFLCRRRLVIRRPISVDRERNIPPRNILVAMGGGEAVASSERIIRLLQRYGRQICVHLVLFREPRSLPGLNAFAENSRIRIGLDDLADEFVWADACIAAGGLTKYEAVFMGVPVAVLSQNQGQAEETKYFAGMGLAYDLGAAAQTDDDQLERKIMHFLRDHDLRNNIAAEARKRFRVDPPTLAVSAILRHLNEKALHVS